MSRTPSTAICASRITPTWGICCAPSCCGRPRIPGGHGPLGNVGVVFQPGQRFRNAFVHAKSLDLRFRESGERLIELAQTATRNEDYATAAQCYAYIASKGPENAYFFTARTQALNMRLQPLLKATPVDREAIAALAQDYDFPLNDLGLAKETAKIAQDLAHIRAFYLQQPNEAIDLLEEVLDVQGLYERTAALCKLELGDILVFQDEIWDASLLFSQVELITRTTSLGPRPNSATHASATTRATSIGHRPNLTRSRLRPPSSSPTTPLTCRCSLRTTTPSTRLWSPCGCSRRPTCSPPNTATRKHG